MDNIFAFFLHPLSYEDVIRFEPKAANKRKELIRKVFEWMPAYKLSKITGVKSKTGATTEGYFIVIPFLPDQFISFELEKVYKKIIDGGKIAEKLGAKILGLGGFTSVVGDAGITIRKNLNIAVTSGNSYTVATALQATKLAATKMDIDIKKANITIVGATGSIGKVAAKILAKNNDKITLVARSLGRLKKTAQEIKDTTGKIVALSTQLENALHNADIIITATSSDKEIIKPYMLKSGSVVCDVALPHDVGRDVAKERNDILVIEGGLVKVPGNVDFHFDFGYPPKIALACMSETMILALEEKFEDYSIGRGLDIEKVFYIENLAKKHGFEVAGLRSFDKYIYDEDIEKIKENVKIKEKNKKSYKISITYNGGK